MQVYFDIVMVFICVKVHNIRNLRPLQYIGSRN